VSDTERTTSGRPSRRTVLRDIASFILGWVLIFQQALFVDPGKVNEVFIWAALALLGVPGTAELVVRAIGTASSRSGPAPPVSPPDSPLPATSSGGGE